MFIYFHVYNLKERKMCWEPTTLLNKKAPHRRRQRKTNQQLTRYVLLFALKLLCSPTKEGNNVARYHTLCFVFTTTRKGVLLTTLHYTTYRKLTYGMSLPRIESVRQNLRQAAMPSQQMGEVSLDGFQSGRFLPEAYRAFCQKTHRSFWQKGISDEANLSHLSNSARCTEIKQFLYWN